MSPTVLCHLGQGMADQIIERFPDLDVVVVPGEGEVPADVAGDALVTAGWTATNLPDVLRRGVAWVHNIGTGVDRFPLDALVDGQVLTCSRGASAVAISEWVMAQLLAFAKDLPASWISEPPEHWNYLQLGTLEGAHLGLIGVGGIGTEIVRRAEPFGMEVRAFRRTDAPPPRSSITLVDDVAELAAWADHLVLAAPLTDQTRHIVGRDLLASAKPGLHLVNIARGGLVNQDALREAVDDGRVARASLDTVDPEPLPAGHWLYSHPSVKLSAHVSWSTPAAFDIMFEIYCDNLRRWLDGEPLAGVVDVEAGY